MPRTYAPLSTDDSDAAPAAAAPFSSRLPSFNIPPRLQGLIDYATQAKEGLSKRISTPGLYSRYIILLAVSSLLAGFAYTHLGFRINLDIFSQSLLGPNMPPVRSVAYYTNWSIYGRKYFPWMVPAERLTHILYSFADLAADGSVVLSDKWSDQDIHYANDSWNDQGNNLYGNFKQIFLLKRKHRHLKVLLSIGGWTYSPKFHPIVVSPAKRAVFVSSAIKLLEDYGLDGLDIDYEYPTNADQAKGYVDLLRDLREGLDSHSRQKNTDYHYLLTIAAPCGPDKYELLEIAQMNQYLDFWNLMAYDYSGSWDQVAGHQANIFGGTINTARAVEYYVASGVSTTRLVIGIPLYGRVFENTEGPGKPYNGIGQGSWEKGVYDYRSLPRPGAYLFRDKSIGASWSYDYKTKEMVSFDSEEIGILKGEFIAANLLGGAMFWEASADKSHLPRPDVEVGPGKEMVPGHSLIHLVTEAMGGRPALEASHNCVHYPGSQFDNVRSGMHAHGHAHEPGHTTPPS